MSTEVINFNTKKILKNFVKWILSPKKNMHGNYITNLLGHKIFSVLANTFFYKIKPFKITKEDQISRSLYNDGIVAIDNFLDDKEFAYVNEKLKEFEEKNHFNYSENRDNSNTNWIHGKLLNVNHEHVKTIEILNKSFNKYIPYVEQVMKKRLHDNPSFNYQHIILPKDKTDINDHNAYWHPDRYYHCVKVFLILDDIEIEHGPYGYMLKSHKTSVQRLKNEYVNSLWFHNYKNKSREYKEKNIYKKKTDYLDHLEKKFFTCKKNTLIISDNKGFHKRGRMHPGYERRMIRVLFYDHMIPKFLYDIKKFLTRKYDKKKLKRLSSKVN